MWKRTLMAAIAALFIAAPAMAYHCPADIAQIDQALASNTTISDAQRAEVVELRNKGEAEHNAGDHDAAVVTLAEAKSILGIE